MFWVDRRPYRATSLNFSTKFEAFVNFFMNFQNATCFGPVTVWL